MNIKSPLLRWSVAVLAVLMLTACGSTTSTPTTSAPASGDITTSAPPATGESTVQKAQTGQVTFTVQFPQAALKKALIDERTVSINVEWYAFNPPTSGSTILTPDPVTGLATATLDVPVGNTEFTAIAKDNNGFVLDRVSTGGEITAGNNTVYLTFLSGDWQFVDAEDNPLPQTFDTTTLAGFSLKSGQAYGAAAKATIDPTKPRGWSEYQLQWQNNTPAALGPLMWAGHTAQFNAPAATGSSFDSDWLNITDPTRSDAYNGGGLDPVQGDRLVWIMSWEDGDGPATITDGGGGDLIPAFQAVGDSQVIDGNHLGGHLMAMTFESLNQTTTGTNVDCQAFWFTQSTTPAAARAAAIKSSLTKAASKAAIGDETTLGNGLTTVNYAECDTDWNATQIDLDGDFDNRSEPLIYDVNGNWRYDAGDSFIDNDGDQVWDYAYYPGTSYDVTEQYSNLVAREFRAKGSQAGSVFTPPTVSAIMPYSSDANTVLLDHLDGATSASILAYSETGAACGSAKPSATPNSAYVAGLDGLGQALSLNPPAGQPAGSGTYLQYPGGQLLSQSNGTIEFWTYLTTYGAGVGLVNQGPFPGSCAGWTYSLGVDASGQLRSAAWAAFDVNSGITTVPLNAWTHVAASWGSTGAKLYINGELVGSDVNTGMPASGYGGSVLVDYSAVGLRIDELRISDMQRTSFSPPAVQPSAVGTWMKIDPVSNEVAILAFLDSSNYYMGEDGVADTGGGPGVEVGTYNFDAVTAQTTFSVAYETNGDWGPATVGVPTTYPVLGLTESTLTVGDPIDGTPFSFSRVTPDPTNPITGSWYFTGGNMGTGSVILVLLTDGTYKAIQADSVNTNDRLFETGTFTWDSGTGTFVGTGAFSSNPSSDVIAFPGTSDTATATINGNTMDWFYNGVTSTATRL